MTVNKGVEVLIAAYGMLKKKHNNLKLILKDQSNLYEWKADFPMKKVFESEFNKKHKIFITPVVAIVMIAELMTSGIIFLQFQSKIPNWILIIGLILFLSSSLNLLISLMLFDLFNNLINPVS